jgi:hypothetical protein
MLAHIRDGVLLLVAANFIGLDVVFNVAALVAVGILVGKLAKPYIDKLHPPAQ